MTTLKASRQGLERALDNLLTHGTCDLLPVSPLLDTLRVDRNAILDKLERVDVLQHTVTTPDQLLTPKSVIGHRTATSLHPIDFLLYTAIVFDCAETIEAFRAPKDKVFSARFSPEAGTARFLSEDWDGFRKQSVSLASEPKCEYVLTLDFVDCFNQISTHRVQNGLFEAGVTEDVTQCIERSFLIPFNLRASQGIPVGNDAGRLLAEVALAMVDQWLHTRGTPYVRYVDDINVFLTSWRDVLLFSEAFHHLINRETLKLAINDDKSRVYKSETFLKIFGSSEEARTEREKRKRYNDKVGAALDWITEHSEIDRSEPYRQPGYVPTEADLDEDFKQELEDAALKESLQALFIEATTGRLDLQMVRHLLASLGKRRSTVLLQLVLERLDLFGPALPSAIRYLIAVADYFTKPQKDQLERYFEQGMRMHMPFYRYWMADLLNRKRALLGVDTSVNILRSWGTEDTSFLGMAAFIKRDVEYVRTKKQYWTSLAPSERMWLIQTAHCLPEGEKAAFFKVVMSLGSLFEQSIARAPL